MSTTIRPAGPDDLGAAVAMAEKFHAFAGFEALAPFCAGSTSATGQMIIDHGVFLVADEGGELIGMIGLMFAPISHNHAYRQAVEMMWWVEPGIRANGVGAALIAAAEQASASQGVNSIMMIHLENSPDSARAMYVARGYRPLETVYVKGL